MPDHVIKSYRYLRIAIVALVVFLGAALWREHSLQANGCWEVSISSYFHTPARGVFVACLVAIGVCLIVLRGNTDLEDSALNLSGMLAFVVAFVPTLATSVCHPVALGPAEEATTRANVANNVWALLVVGVLALGFVGYLIVGSWRGRDAAGRRALRPILAGYAVAVVAVGVGAWVFAGRRDLLLDRGHDVAAVTMFIGIVVVVFANALHLGRRKAGGSAPGSVAAAARTPYAVIGVVMALTLAGVLVLAFTGLGGPQFILWVEVVLIGEFAIFWVVQTRELWDEGLRDGG